MDSNLEAWSTDKHFKDNSNFHLPSFDFIHQEKNTGKKWGGILIYLQNNMKSKTLKELSVSDGNN